MVSSTKGARITGEERQQLMLSYVRRYQAGESIRSLATDTGRSYGFVQGLLKEAGVPLRSRGGATRGAEAEAERRERQVRVDAARAAERADEAAPADPQHRGPTPTPASGRPAEHERPGAERTGEVRTGDAETDQVETGAPDPYVADATVSQARKAAQQADAERRDLYRAQTSPADLGLPTPPLGVLVPKKDKGKKKAKKIAAKKAEQAGIVPQHLRDLVRAKDAAAKDLMDQDRPGKDGKTTGKADKDKKAGRDKKAGKDKKAKKAKKSEDKGKGKTGKDKKPKT